MRYPPEDWVIKPEDEFGSYMAPDNDTQLTAEVLLQVSRTAMIDGCYKIKLGGSEILSATILAKDVLIMGGAASFILTIERWPRDIAVKVNTMTSDWFDVEER